MRSILNSAVVFSLFSACGHAPGHDERDPKACECAIGAEVPAAGTISLRVRALGPDTDETYWKASVSFEHGGASGSITETNNDWDLLFGNDKGREEKVDTFQVNTVTDDRSPRSSRSVTWASGGGAQGATRERPRDAVPRGPRMPNHARRHADADPRATFCSLGSRRADR